MPLVIIFKDNYRCTLLPDRNYWFSERGGFFAITHVSSCCPASPGLPEAGAPVAVAAAVAGAAGAAAAGAASGAASGAVVAAAAAAGRAAAAAAACRSAPARVAAPC